MSGKGHNCILYHISDPVCVTANTESTGAVCIVIIIDGKLSVELISSSLIYIKPVFFSVQHYRRLFVSDLSVELCCKEVKDHEDAKKIHEMKGASMVG